MKIRTAVLRIAAMGVVITGVIGGAGDIYTPEKTVEGSSAEKGLHIRLVSDDPGEIDFKPGAEIPVNMRVENVGTESARVFVKMKVPTAEGAVLTDGTEDPEVLEFEPGDGWSEIEDGVYYYEELLESGGETQLLISSWTIPHYDLSLDEDGEVVSGTVTVEQIGTLMNDVQIRGYSIMDMPGTPEQLWRMCGGE